jgi:photosystem II stability/assembly factor-like uncharacterized protein
MSKYVRSATASLLVLGTLFLACGSVAVAQAPKEWADLVTWRSIGPASMSGRITSIAVYEKEPTTFWIASASGGLLKTTNNGIDFTHQFENQPTVSIGDVQVAQSDPNIVWVGTGESNPRNSVSYGDGVYKSTDGGKTFNNMGLKSSFQIGRIAIHPTNPDIVYVGALGRLWGPNEERGLFKTDDGGKKWEKIHFVDDKTGVIDVQMNPANPEELLIATYERLRDNTDSNDPIKRYGAGSGMYKTTDGGKTFAKVTSGLPTCKMGRIGLNYFRADPKVVFAVIESEKIAKEPDNASFIGLRGEDAEIGARIIDITKDAPADKAGLKTGDVILEIDGRLIVSNEEFDMAIRRKLAGEKIKVRFVREKVPNEVEIELGKRPTSGARARNVFDGSLGGQVENRQDQQGPEGFQYGGIYVSEDGGSSWNRVNSLNPRPMYYSQVRVDPVDRKNVYVLGTSLYRSNDGGKTFKGDGGNDGIHVDHHAMWIDSSNPKHMILGNDGGLHVTYDRMDNWDSLNNFAIGQFYHVGVDTRRDYKVYGGLQDNGSWGGPSRSGHDSGPVNTDWFRVGGGDGFITLVDPDDPDQIYFESQNGGMGRINTRTGERGFIRPRPQRGMTYRFNWKTPFLLSPHNSEMFYCAGNYVFRSYNKGDNLAAISKEITNSIKGSASALTESPVQQGILYVGTTCGAVWMTKDGGLNWDPIFYKKVEGETAAAPEQSESGGGGGGGGEQAAENPQAGESSEEGRGQGRGRGRGRGQRPAGEASEGEQKEMEGEKAAEKTEAQPEAKPAAEKIDSPLNGTWTLAVTSENAPPNFREFDLTISVHADQSVTGMTKTARGENAITSGKFDAQTNELTFQVESRMGALNYKAKLDGEKLTGSLTAGEGRLTIEFSGTKKKEDSPVPANENEPALAKLISPQIALIGVIAFQDDNPVNGVWKGLVENEQLPNGRLEFELHLRMNEKGQVTGKSISAMGELAIKEGFYNKESKKLTFVGENDDSAFDFEAQISGADMSGSVAAGEFQMGFTAKRSGDLPEDSAVGEVKPDDAAKTAEKAAEKPADTPPAKTDEMKDAPKQDTPKPEATEKPAQEKPAQEKPAQEKPAAAALAKPDVISGTWTGKMIGERMPRGMGEFTFELKLDAENKISGKFGNERGDNDITDGKYNVETKAIEMSADTGRFTLSFTGKVESDKMTGTISFGEQFSTEFEATRTAAADATTPTEDKKPAAGENKALADLVPGPRWVSCLEASRYQAGRCYLTLDGHKYDDDEPYVFVSEDFGKTWKSIRGNLPKEAGITHAVREDIKNENVLYLGCEMSAWFSLDRGKSWTRFAGGLPTVAVHDFAQHPTAGELIAATHGRAIWIADISALRQWSVEAANTAPRLYQPNSVVRWRSEPQRGDTGPRRFVGTNPNTNAHLYYSLPQSARSLELTVSDVKGQVIRRFTDAPTTKGMHHVEWDFRGNPSASANPAGRGGRGGFGALASTGVYVVTLRVDGAVLSQTLEVVADPSLPADARPESLEEFQYSEGDEVEGNIKN